MKIVISGNDLSTKNTLETILKNEKYKIVASGCDGFDIIKLCRQHNPDIVILEKNIPLLDGISVAQIIKSEDIAGAVVFIISEMNLELLKKIKSVDARGCVFTPIDKTQLIYTLEIASQTGKNIRELKKEKQSIEQKFEDRKAIDKAKGILMLNENITEDEAYIRIRKYSMEKRVTMREIAEFIIVSNQFKS